MGIHNHSTYLPASLILFTIQQTSFAALFDQLRHETRPAGLVTGADARTVVAMEVLVEQDQIAPMRISLEFLLASVDRPPIRVAQKNSYEPAGNISGHFPKTCVLTGIRGTLHPELIAKEVMKLLQRFHEKKIQRKPDRPPPIRISTKQPTIRFRRLIVDAMFMPFDGKHIRMVSVKLRKGTNAVGG